ncbi:transcriptional regulator [Pseudorhizobium halotolerans]|uniref:Transcriptional regulator n=1 Tax=Pseudorhizobium halotolerans TaxID=1233081 RepID=A0ABN7K039_9HYPH|nr:metalloregulator ArsR/SmtB family transcription factor [Pseudorhizobium halotolerans]CAD7056013.1 transcriptional regulator [Pseudorhizobium halotolerans]
MATFHPHLPTIFAALSDPTRLKVVERLAMGPASISELSKPFEMAGPSFLKHIKVLENAGLVRSQKLGRVRSVTLVPDALRWVDEWADQHRGRWEQRLDQLGSFLSQGDN